MKRKEIKLDIIHSPHNHKNSYRLSLLFIVNNIQKDLTNEIQNKDPKDLRDYQNIINSVFTLYISNNLLGITQVNKFITSLKKYHDTKFFRSIKKAIDMDIQEYLSNKQIEQEIKKSIEVNVDLIKDIPVELKKQIEIVVSDAFTDTGIDRQLIHQKLSNIIDESLKGRFKVARNRVKLIADDQTNKIISDFTEIRHRQLGIVDYVWIGVDDSRERASHVANNNSKFSYNYPPLTGKPGSAIRCRCIAQGVLNSDIINRLAYGELKNAA